MFYLLDKTGLIRLVNNIKSLFLSHSNDENNPHKVTLSQLGVTVDSSIINYMDGATSNIQSQLNNKAYNSHTHTYAGSSSSGGAATSANKLNTNAGSSTQPVYFSNGIPVKITHTLGKSVPSDAVFTDTTYGEATTSDAGLMSAADKSKLDAITTSADSVSFTQSLTSGTKIGTITINGTDTDIYCQTSTDTNTDLKSTSGNTSNKIFLIGATSQSTSGQTTYSHDTVYVGTDGCLYSGGNRVDTEIISASEPSGQVTGDCWLLEY